MFRGGRLQWIRMLLLYQVFRRLLVTPSPPLSSQPPVMPQIGSVLVSSRSLVDTVGFLISFLAGQELDMCLFDAKTTRCPVGIRCINCLPWVSHTQRPRLEDIGT